MNQRGLGNCSGYRNMHTNIQTLMFYVYSLYSHHFYLFRDEGHLTNKKHLPVMKLNFGGNQGVRQRQATFELGPLYCSGKAERDLHESGYLNSSPTSCRDILLKGITQVSSVCEISCKY